MSLPAGADETRVVTVAARADIRVYGARAYHAAPDHAPAALLLGYGGILEEEIERGIGALADVIDACAG